MDEENNGDFNIRVLDMDFLRNHPNKYEILEKYHEWLRNQRKKEKNESKLEYERLERKKERIRLNRLKRRILEGKEVDEEMSLPVGKEIIEVDENGEENIET